MSPELFKRSGAANRVSWVKNRRARPRDWRRIGLWSARLVLAAALTACALWVGPVAAARIRKILRGQEALSARTLILEGNRLVSREAVLVQLGVGAGDNLLAVDLREIARRLEELPAVKSAAVNRQYPSAVHVRLTERRPLMVLSGAEGLVIDEEGVVIGRAGGAEGLPVVAGLGVAGRRVTDRASVTRMLEIREASREAGLGWPGPFTLFDFSSLDGPVAFLPESVPVRLGWSGYRGKLSRLAWVLPQLAGNGVRADYIDLRFEQRVVVGRGVEEEPQPEKEQVRDSG